VHGVGRAIVIARVIAVLEAVSNAVVWLNVDPKALAPSQKTRVRVQLDLDLDRFAAGERREIRLPMGVLR
jgi:hypothetical protein